MNEQNLEQKLIAAYDKMMHRVEHLLDTAEQQALPVLQKNIEKAKLQAIELKEISKEEAEKIGGYLRRDIQDAADYLERSGKEISTWFNFDLELVEDRLLDVFSKIADRTRIELAQLAAQAKRAQEYHTGEITSIGTLACQNCDTLVHFKKTSRIPPCPKCHKAIFVRTRRK
ncbi:MAG: zinc ribbon-containing protein [Gammaproteobacteria bacterium]|nr:zinc ribbon-containing protein [Gammaproteobacteria bacterium]MDH5591579.1 zinc ribbon-containing protein [Gammaproteobacteria bacterium]